jgi:hypothetical protein
MDAIFVPVSDASPECLFKFREGPTFSKDIAVFFFEAADTGFHGRIVSTTISGETRSDIIIQQGADIFVSREYRTLVLVDNAFGEINRHSFQISARHPIRSQGSRSIFMTGYAPPHNSPRRLIRERNEVKYSSSAFQLGKISEQNLKGAGSRNALGKICFCSERLKMTGQGAGLRLGSGTSLFKMPDIQQFTQRFGVYDDFAPLESVFDPSAAVSRMFPDNGLYHPAQAAIFILARARRIGKLVVIGAGRDAE